MAGGGVNGNCGGGDEVCGGGVVVGCGGEFGDGDVADIFCFSLSNKALELRGS